ncbi:MAG: hypothetical protein ACYCWE_18735 [Eubacteriales bacterium]
MYLWSANKDAESHTIGNGEMLIFASGPNITGVFGPPYTSLPFFSAVIDDSMRQITALTERDGGIWLHKLTCSPTPIISYKQTASFIRFTDHVDRMHNVFVRRFNAIQTLTFKLIIPPYVRVYYNELYQLSGKNYNCATFIIRDGTASAGEQRLVCVLDGDVSFNTADNEICIKTGSGNIIMAAGTPDKAVRNAVFIINKYDQSFDRTRLYYFEYLSRFHAFNPAENEKLMTKALTVLESAAVFLKSMQSADGGVIKSMSKPFADMSEQYTILRAFLALGCRTEAKSIIEFMLKKYTYFGDIKAFESTGSDLFRENSLAEYAAVPAYILLSAAAYLKSAGDKNLIITLVPMLNHAAETQIKNIRGGLMISDGCEPAIICGYSTHKAAYTVSARNTLLYIESLKAMSYISETINLEIINSESAEKAIKRAENAFSETFGKTGFKSYAKFPDGMRRERFRYGICDMCGDKFYPRINVVLERYEDSYLCERCYNKGPFPVITEAPEINDDIVTADILTAPYLGCNIVKKETILDYSEKKKISETCFLPVFSGSERCSYSDAGYLLYAFTEYDDKNSDSIFKSLVEAAGTNDLWNEYYKSEEYTAYTNAICAEAVIKYLTKLNIL